MASVCGAVHLLVVSHSHEGELSFRQGLPVPRHQSSQQMLGHLHESINLREVSRAPLLTTIAPCLLARAAPLVT